MRSASDIPRPSDLLHGLFLPDVAVHEMRGGGPDSLLHPSEAACVERSVPRRRREFAAGRACARAALASLGLEASGIAMGREGQPSWPAGVVGSITHTGDFCAAAIARASDYLAIGIDAERRGRLSERLWSQICTDTEIVELRRLPPGAASDRATRLFCAKEAFYKCQYALTESWLDFGDLAIRIDGNRFEVDVLGSAPSRLKRCPHRWIGKLVDAEGLVAAGVCAVA